jgi:hypothetical protein
MNVTALRCPTCLPALLDQSPAVPRCACHPWQHHDHAPHAAQTSFIDAQATNGDRLSSSLTTDVGVHTRPAQLKSP